MDIVLCKKAIKNYFATHTQKDILKDMYEDDIKDYLKFNRKLWEKVIDEQIEIDRETLQYFHMEKKLTPLLHIFDTFHSSLEERLPWIRCDGNCDFPTMFRVFSHGDKKIVLVLLIGQGSSMTLVTPKSFRKWMKRIDATYKFPRKATTLDEFESAVKDTLKSLRKQIRNAKDTLDE